MGIGRRLFDGARANLNTLMERVLRDELQGASEAQLADELQRRQQERSSQESERQQRLAMEAAARSRGSARKKDEQAKSKARTPGQRIGKARARQARLQVLYSTLGVPPGAPFGEVKKAYRTLMREHHPDRHAGDPSAERAAGERAARIGAAYAELEALLDG